MSDIRTALEEAFSSAESTSEDSSTDHSAQPAADAGEGAGATQPTQDEPATPVSDRARTPDGKFAAASTEAKETPVQPAPEPAPVRKAPSSWKPDAQAAFLKADRGEALTNDEIKLLTAEAERRENDFHKGVSEFKSHSERARSYDAAIAPYQAHLQSLGVDAPTAISALMKADYTLRTSDPATKAAYLSQLAREYGVDLGQAQAAPPMDPQMQYLTQQLNELRQNQMQWHNSIQQQEQARAQAELSQFATAGKPHFDAVRGDMADLLETGKAKTLEEAYEMAAWMRPEIRTSLIDQQRADAQRKAMEQVQARKAQTASVSVKGSGPVSAGGQPVNGSLRDIIAAQFADNL